MNAESIKVEVLLFAWIFLNKDITVVTVTHIKDGDESDLHSAMSKQTAWLSCWLTRLFGWQHIYYLQVVLSNQEMHQAHSLASPSAHRSVMPFLIFWQIPIPSASVLLSLTHTLPHTHAHHSSLKCPLSYFPQHFNCFSSRPTFMNLSWGFQAHSQDTIYAIQCASSYLS